MIRLQIAPETLPICLKAAAAEIVIALLLGYLPSALVAKEATNPADETLPAAAV